MFRIRQSIQIEVPLPVVTETWPRFVQWVLTGPRKLACDQLLCVDLTKSELVHFESGADGSTIVAFELELPDEAGGGPDEQNGSIEAKLTHDLLLFKDYVETTPAAARAGAHNDAAASARSWARRGKHVHRDVQSDDPGSPARPWTRS
jgi:hypothetical protein